MLFIMIKKLLILILVSVSCFSSNYAYSQEIDPSLLKDLSPDQIEMAKEQLNKSKLKEISKPIVTESTLKNKLPENIDINVSSNKKYGYSYFDSVPTNISAVGDLPLPNDYKISLNDQFTVILSGSKEAIF